MKIVSSGKGIHSFEFYEKKKRTQRNKIFAFCFLILVIIVSLIFFFRWDRFLITEIVIADEIIIGREEISEAISKNLSGNYLYLIPKNNSLIYGKGRLKENLIKEFPRFTTLDVEVEGFKKLIVSAGEREPFALYCPQYVHLGENTKCFFLDKTGLIFRSAPSFSDGVYFIYTQETALESPLGKEFLPLSQFKDLSKFIENLLRLNIISTSLKVRDDDYELTLKSGGKIIWNRATNFDSIFNDLEAFLSDEEIIKQKDFLEKIDRLDLRTQDKVFWKLKE